MPQSLSYLLMHIIFSTKNRAPVLDLSIRPALHAYLATVYDECIAAFSGALKDAAEPGQAIDAPILDHPQFEQLEAKGLASHGGKIREAVKLVKHLTK